MRKFADFSSNAQEYSVLDHKEKSNIDMSPSLKGRQQDSLERMGRDQIKRMVDRGLSIPVIML